MCPCCAEEKWCVKSSFVLVGGCGYSVADRIAVCGFSIAGGTTDCDDSTAGETTAVTKSYSGSLFWALSKSENVSVLLPEHLWYLLSIIPSLFVAKLKLWLGRQPLVLVKYLSTTEREKSHVHRPKASCYKCAHSSLSLTFSYLLSPRTFYQTRSFCRHLSSKAFPIIKVSSRKLALYFAWTDIFACIYLHAFSICLHRIDAVEHYY
jgi:hypothetical protein